MTTESKSLTPYRKSTSMRSVNMPSGESESLHRNLRWPTRLGLVLTLTFVMGFGVWAFLVPLAGGAIAPGTISPDGSRRTVQHLEGGIIHELLVRDGDFVEAGKPLVVLSSVQPQATFDQLTKQQRDLKITLLRLDAETADQAEAIFTPEIGDGSREAELLIESQKRLFQVRQAAHHTKRDIFSNRIEQLEEQIKGFEAQIDSTTLQIELIGDEVSAKAKLYERGYVTKPELLRLKRIEAELDGRLGQYQASIAQAKQQIGEARLQIISADAEREQQIATQAEKIRAELGIIEEKLLSSEDVLDRTVVRAPVSGTIVSMRYKTIGGVVQPGTPILDIVPAKDNLIIDARVSPMDIDVVRAGLEAKIQLSAFSMRSTPRVQGYVQSVSADRIIDGDNQEPYYLARVEVDRDDLERLDPTIELVPGMPADVIIVTGERTMATYLLEPILNAVWKSFREA